MSRLDLLRMKRTASTYGQPLTLLEELELARLESDLADRRLGRATEGERPPAERRSVYDPAAAVLCEG